MYVRKTGFENVPGRNEFLQRSETFIGEVQAICRFWVFDGNGLLGHRLVDSRWFEKNPPTESGWKRRSKKKTTTYWYFARKCSWRNMCFQVRAIRYPKYQYVGVFFFFSNAVFNHFPLKDFSQTNENRSVGAPRAHFRQKLRIDKKAELLFCEQWRG